MYTYNLRCNSDLQNLTNCNIHLLTHSGVELGHADVLVVGTFAGVNAHQTQSGRSSYEWGHLSTKLVTDELFELEKITGSSSRH